MDNFYEHNYEREDALFEKALSNYYGKLKKVPKISNAEYEILEFCHNRNMKEFLREEFEKHPIKLDDDGNLVGENPFDKERRELGIVGEYHAYDPLYGTMQAYQTIEQLSTK